MRKLIALCIAHSVVFAVWLVSSLFAWAVLIWSYFFGFPFRKHLDPFEVEMEAKNANADTRPPPLVTNRPEPFGGMWGAGSPTSPFSDQSKPTPSCFVQPEQGTHSVDVPGRHADSDAVDSGCREGCPADRNGKNF